MKDNTLQGSFYDNLNRNNTKIRADRAIAITEDAHLLYKREVEDMEMKLNRLTRERESMLDLSPTSADSLILASDFNAEEFVKKDIRIGTEIRNLEITIQIAKERYKYLFIGVEADKEAKFLTEN